VAGPCGPDSWYIEIGDEDPVEVVSRMSRNQLGEPLLVHYLRHLAWLAKDDPVVEGTLSVAWKRVLDGYTPEPFRAL
jgi:hypothetical protein